MLFIGFIGFCKKTSLVFYKWSHSQLLSIKLFIFLNKMIQLLKIGAANARKEIISIVYHY